MKNLIILVILGIAGYFSYQYFGVSQSVDSTEGETESTSYEYLPDVPGECEQKGGNMKDAIYGYDIGRVTMAQLNFATRSFQSCLRDAGFSDSQINKTVDGMKQDVMSLNPGSAKGY